MSQLLGMARDWIPTLAVLVGGSWILFRWLREEALRTKREIPALYGQVNVEMTALKEDRNLLNVEIDWRNTSPYPVFIDTENTRFDLFEVPSECDIGPIDPKSDLGAPVVTLHPLSDKKQFVFAPNTDNQMRGHFIVAADHVYILRTKVYRDRKAHGKGVFAWTRETVIDGKESGKPSMESRKSAEQDAPCDAGTASRSQRA